MESPIERGQLTLQCCIGNAFSSHFRYPVKLFVFHTPELSPVDQVPDCAIAIDVLRATTTIVTALSSGAEAVQVFSSMESLMQVSEAWAPEQRLRAGERGGAKVEGCDLGNSPLDCTPERVAGKRLFMSTTNGTRCLERIRNSTAVLAGALINRQAIVNYLLANQPETVWMVGSGWEGSYALEDTACAGAIAHALTETWATSETASEPTWIGNDEVVGAIALFTQWQDRLHDLMYHASHGQRLKRLACFDDLKYCSELDVLDTLPIQKEAGILVKY
jgi:2-phosphosulfolactate phosphatase